MSNENATRSSADDISPWVNTDSNIHKNTSVIINLLVKTLAPFINA